MLQHWISINKDIVNPDPNEELDLYLEIMGKFQNDDDVKMAFDFVGEMVSKIELAQKDENANIQVKDTLVSTKART